MGETTLFIGAISILSTKSATIALQKPTFKFQQRLDEERSDMEPKTYLCPFIVF